MDLVRSVIIMDLVRLVIIMDLVRSVILIRVSPNGTSVTPRYGGVGF